MQTRALGKSGVEASVIGMGCWPFGGGAYWGEQSQQDVNSVVAMALDAGVNFFDTAELYNAGASERSLGEALRGKRGRAVICSKVSPENAYHDTLIKRCKASLKRLQTDYIDVYMLHWPLDTLPSDVKREAPMPTVEEAFGALCELKRDGLIRSIGVSNFGVRQLSAALRCCGEISCNELAYNILSRAIEKEILPFCRQNDIGVVAAMTLQQGLLAGVYATPEDVPQSVARSRHFHHKRGNGATRHGLEGEEAETFRVIDGLSRIADGAGLSVAELSAAWVLAQPGVACALVGSRNAAELKKNLKVAELRPEPSVLEQVNTLSEPLLHKLGYNPDYYENAQNTRIH